MANLLLKGRNDYGSFYVIQPTVLVRLPGTQFILQAYTCSSCVSTAAAGY
jgi:hypothetical protein